VTTTPKRGFLHPTLKLNMKGIWFTSVTLKKSSHMHGEFIGLFYLPISNQFLLLEFGLLF
jgi:hypothetical protein